MVDSVKNAISRIRSERLSHAEAAQPQAKASASKPGGVRIVTQ